MVPCVLILLLKVALYNLIQKTLPPLLNLHHELFQMTDIPVTSSGERGIPHKHVAVQVEISRHPRRLDICILTRSIEGNASIALVVHADCRIQPLLSLIFRIMTDHISPFGTSATADSPCPNPAACCPNVGAVTSCFNPLKKWSIQVEEFHPDHYSER